MHLLRYEVVGFGSLIAMYWLVELPIVPTLLLGEDAHAAWDRLESVLLTTLAFLVALPIAFRTRRLASRVSYLEGLLRRDPWSGRNEGLAGREVLVARLGDGSLTMAWRFALDDWVQVIMHPEIVARVVAGRAWRTAAGSLRQEYEIEVDGGFRLVLDGSHFRFMPVCDGRPMHFVGTTSAGGRTTLLYQCRDCQGRTEILP